jgi:diguanylate cyclase (GGDEF)-like protein
MTPSRATRRRRFEDGSEADPRTTGWIGLRFEDTELGRERSAVGLRLIIGEGGGEGDDGDGPASLVSLGGVLAWYAGQISSILDDPVTGLAGRAEFQASLSHAIELANERGRPLSLLLINPDDFTAVNERRGHEAGDSVLREMGRRLREAHRTSDSIAKYGGAIFASFLKDTDRASAKLVAEKVWSSLSESPYLDGSIQLSISIGVAVMDPGDETLHGHLELIRRADKALNAAKRFGGGRIDCWESALDGKELGSVDRMTGVYTGNMAKDYRNMTLLSDTMTAVAGSTDVGGLAENVAERLYTTLKADRVGLFEVSSGELTLLKGVTKKADGLGGHEASDGFVLAGEARELLEEARREKRAMHASFTDEYSEKEIVSFAVPLLLRDRLLGCLYLDGRTDTFGLEGSSDLGFVRAFATQLAVAIDRARLSEQQQRQSEREQSRLRAEVDDLRASLQLTKLEYRSREMEAVLDTVRRVAPTGATVLVTGESGTGKELVARTIHELSPVRNKPVVVVDCGAIPTTLIESELFGHERGAYTGAQDRRVGRLLEAEGGTVILDEIGELPLEVQSKLLRFVQERQVTPVGGTRARRVDTRLVAVTNRELAVEAAAGRFRDDLYYRLNVVRVTVPPLRERPEDVLHLADYFLDHYARQYQKRELRFDDSAKALMLDHYWPGNVRELQNRVMQAVILCEGDELGVDELELEHTPTGQTVEMDLSMVGPGAVRVARSLNLRDDPTPLQTANTPEDSWKALRDALGKQIDVVLADPSGQPVPLGTWLLEDIVLQAYDASGGIPGRARTMLGIPETTFRRRLRKATSKARAELLTRKPHWRMVAPLIGALVRTKGIAKGDVLQTARQTLLDEVVARVDSPAVGAALMGVTVRTFRRWTSKSEDDAVRTSLASTG